MELFIQGFSMIFHVHYFLYMIVGVTLGTILAFLPGLSAATGIAILLPLTYGMPPLDALVLLMSTYSGGLFGGGVTAILINTPGSPASIVTTFDGHPMHLRGETERALGLALASSFVGAIIGTAFLVIAAEPMAAFATKFGPGELFWVAIFGLSMLSCMADDVVKSLFSGFIGILLGTVGISDLGVVRGTFGNVYLMEGIPLVPTLIGLLALPAVIDLLSMKLGESAIAQKVNGKKLLKGLIEVFHHPVQAVLCSLGGVIVGVIPAAGASIASLLCYNLSKQFSKTPEKFGTGCPEGIIACETANNASEGGALATMFVLGIPGSNAAAMMLGALALFGWPTGPRMFSQYAEIIYAAFSSLALQQIVMVVVGLGLCFCAAKIAKLPVKYLAPAIVAFLIVGVYSCRYTIFDCGLMLFFCIVGWYMKRSNYPVMPLVLGLLLGGMADSELMRIYQAFDSFWDIFRSPIVCALAAISIISMLLPTIMKKVKTTKG